MINERIQNYIDNHSFCSEYLFKDWEAFLDFLYEEGGRVSSILWWEHCKKNFQHGKKKILQILRLIFMKREIRVLFLVTNTSATI